MADIILDEKDLKAQPEFWATFDADAADENLIDERGEFRVKLRYVTDAEYNRLIDRKAGRKQKQRAKQIGLPVTLTTQQAAELLAEEVVLDWEMPALRFRLTVPISPEREAQLTNGKGFQDSDRIPFSPAVCTRFLMSNLGYSGWVRQRCRSATAMLLEEEKATENLPDASETD